MLLFECDVLLKMKTRILWLEYLECIKFVKICKCVFQIASSNEVGTPSSHPCPDLLTAGAQYELGKSQSFSVWISHLLNITVSKDIMVYSSLTQNTQI